MTFLSNISQMFKRRDFILACIGAATAIMFPSFDDILSAFRSEKLLENGYHAILIFAALSSDVFTLLLPILCALPYTTCFVDDIRSGFIKEYLPRTNIRNYLTSKIVACAASGGAVLAIGVAFAYAMSALTFTPMEAALKSGEVPVNYLVEIVGKVAICMFSGAFWSVLGMTFAALTDSRFMAYASPFVMYYVLIILHERYFPNFFVLYPKEWLNPQSEWMFGNWGVVLLLIELTTLAAFCFWTVARKRLASI
ncbi:MAG: hypothetical protein ABFD11_08445 [Christensenella sp.]